MGIHLNSFDGVPDGFPEGGGLVEPASLAGRRAAAEGYLLRHMEHDEAAGDIDFPYLLTVVAGGKWLIAGVVAAVLVLAMSYLSVAPPIFRADALLQIQNKSPNDSEGLANLEQALTGEMGSQAKAELQIIRSRSVLGEVVDRAGLQISAEPRYFPVIGRALARSGGASEGGAPEHSALSWLGKFTWSPAEVDVERLDVPPSLMDRGLVLTARDESTYRVYGPEGEVLVDGAVGRAESNETPYGTVTILVSRLRLSSSPAAFDLVRRTRLRVIQELSNRLRLEEQVADTGIIEIALEGTDRDEITKIVNEVADTYLRQNVGVRTEEAERSLAFLEGQLPELRQQLRESEDKLNDFREQKRSIDLNAEGQALLDEAVALEQRLLELELQRSELLQLYKPSHPMLRAITDQIRDIRDKREALNREIGDLPGIQRETISLRRDVEVNTSLYMSLLNRSQELKVIKAGTVGNVRIVDPAVTPIGPVKPRRTLTLAIALALGTVLGFGAVFVRAVLRRGVGNPADIEQRTGLPVYGVVPYSHWQHQEDRNSRHDGGSVRLLVDKKPNDMVTEALRSLRTSLYFSQMEAGRNTLLFTGPGPGVGKSFVSVNVARLLAQAGKKVIVVDGDMRRGHLHRTLGHERFPGLSEVLSGQVAWRDAVKRVESGAAFDVIVSGDLPPNPAELLMRPRVGGILGEIKEAYDVVIMDGPPMLAVTDAVVMAAYGMIVFLVVRAGKTHIQEISSCKQRLANQTSPIAGVIVNAMRESDARICGAYYSHYHYSYDSKS